MKHGFTLLLKLVIFLVAIAALAGMVRLPQTEGRAANLNLIEIYSDPFIIYLYLASIPFFIALYQVFKLLGLVDKNKIFSQASLKAVRNIKYCAIVLAGFLAAAISYIFVVAEATNDDGAGAIAIGIITIVATSVVAFTAAIFQKRMQNEGIKSGA